jgi:deaminated glutathione amidase
MKTNFFQSAGTTCLMVFFCLSVLGAQVPQKSRLVVGICQFPVSSDIAANSRWIKKQMREAKSRGAEIVQFPECALSGYGGEDYASLDSLDWNELHNQTTSILATADSLNVWLLLGSTHRLSDGYKPHNSMYVIDPDGKILDRYDKRFCTEGDLKYYTPGDHYVTFDVHGITCGLLICYDIRFPELYRDYCLQQVQVLFQSFYNARQKKGGIHPVIMPVTAQAHAGINHFFMLLANSSTRYSWPNHFITPDGRIAKKLKPDHPGVLIAAIDVSQKYYDASAPFRADAIHGKRNSGETVSDERSKNRTVY